MLTSSTIAVAGDWHGNTSWAQHQIKKAAKDTYTILQVGDFGYWEHSWSGEYYLDRVSLTAVEQRVNVIWLDGNHENHPLLWERYADAHRSVQGFWQIRPNIWYSPRGNAWTWHGKRLMTVGGSVSIDKVWRKAGESWWHTEYLYDEELDFAISQGKVDYLFTHDAPTTMPLPSMKVDNDSNIMRQRMNMIHKSAEPAVWFHGHYHVYCEYYHFDTKVIGLNMDGSDDNMVLFDLTTGELV